MMLLRPGSTLMHSGGNPIVIAFVICAAVGHAGAEIVGILHRRESGDIQAPESQDAELHSVARSGGDGM